MVPIEITNTKNCKGTEDERRKCVDDSFIPDTNNPKKMSK
jgi:hypothetical protein